MPPTTEPELLALEDVCRGRYAIEREVGRGGMGIVVLARDLALDRQVAIKLLPPVLARVPELRERFLREARTAAGLAHPNVVPVHAVEAHGDVVFFVMGYVDGESLGRRVQRGGPLGPGETARVLRDLAWALAYAHGRGVIHRDVKPDNVLLDRGTGRALLTDFGIARVADAATSLTAQGHVLGTAAYMSPEQAEGAPLDGRSDLYALGAVGHFALTGMPPIEAPTAASLLARKISQPAPSVAARRVGLPPALARAIDRCLRTPRDERFDSAEALAEALDEAPVVPEAPLPVRNFVRLAEQYTMLSFLLTMLMSTTGRGAATPVALATVLVTFAVDLGRRARALLRTGYSATEVQRGFVLEDAAREAELLAMYGEARPEAVRRRRAQRVAGAAALVALVLLQSWATRLPPDAPNRTLLRWLLTAAMLGAGLTFAFFTAASPDSERRAARAWTLPWRGPLTHWLFSLAGLGLDGARVAAPASADDVAPRAHALPDAVRERHPDLPALLGEGEARLVALRAREARLRGVLAEVGSGDDDASGALAARGAITRGDLLSRRLELVGDVRGAAEEARARHAEVLGAMENVRIQLARVRAELATPAALDEDVAALRDVLAAGAAALVPTG